MGRSQIAQSFFGAAHRVRPLARPTRDQSAAARRQFREMHGFDRSSAMIDRLQINRGTHPRTPKLQSMRHHGSGMPRMGPAMSARGMTPAQAISPKVMTHLLRTGSTQGPMNAMAMTRWAKASQSVP